MDAAEDSDLYTVQEFYELLPEGQKGDLLEGVIYLASPDTLDADQINGFILALLSMYVSARKLGKVTGSRFAYRLSEHRAPEPDVAFVRADRVATVLTRREGLAAPDVVVEVVARDSRYRDYHEKKQIYESSGVPEYWLIDPLQHRCVFHRLREGRYHEVALEDSHRFRSKAVPGFWLDVRWILGPAPASAWDCLQVLLAD